MRDKILALLREADGELSGAKISKDLHISRAAVAKHIKSLRKDGYIIDALPRRGYTFRAAAPGLLAAEISHHLKRPGSFQLHALSSVDSTNTYLRRLAVSGAPHFTAVTAEEQTGGRGRLERSWYSPPAAGVWLSLLLRPALPPQHVQWLTLLVAVSVGEALDAYGFDCRIKWPNDILIGYKKVCGILLEMQSDMDRVHWVVAGLGLNVNNKTFPPELAATATSLYQETKREFPRAELTAAILEKVKDNYERLLNEGFAPLREKWLAKAVGIGQKASVVTPQGLIEGTALDMDGEGYLLLKTEDGDVRRITGGDFLPRQI